MCDKKIEREINEEGDREREREGRERAGEKEAFPYNPRFQTQKKLLIRGRRWRWFAHFAKCSGKSRLPSRVQTVYLI